MAGHAAARPLSWAVRDGSRRLNWADLKILVDQVAGDLETVGLREGERISLWMANRIEALVVFLACSRNGYVCNPSLHRNYTVPEVLGLIGRIRSSAIFVEDGYGLGVSPADVCAALAGHEGLRKVYGLPAERGAGGSIPDCGVIPRM